MRVTKEYSFPITVDQDEAVNRLKSFTSDKASVKNMIKNKKYYCYRNISLRCIKWLKAVCRR